MRRKQKTFMLITLLLIIILIFAAIGRRHLGKAPYGERLERIRQSPNFQNGEFRNLSPTIQITAEGGKWKLFKENFLNRPKRRVPTGQIPTIKTDLKNLDPTEDILVWFGHSSYFFQVDGVTFLVDPVFSNSLSPVPGVIKAFKNTNIYTPEEIPDIDYLIITHDHWDHLDYPTVEELKPRTGTVICGLGVGSHFEYWGFLPEQIIERDWDETISLQNGFSIHTVPTRHFSGRFLSPNSTLWTSYILTTPSMTIFLGGDGGYDTHFKTYGERFPDIDLAIVENGQYGRNWKYIHTTPEEALQAALDLGAKRILPVHNSKFALANHPWDEPMERITKASESANIELLTPKIGEKVNLKEEQHFSQWWKGID